MTDERYLKLRKFLDQLPGGFPETEDGVEIKLLQKFFTPEEAELVSLMNPMPETVDAIAKRWGMEESAAAPRLEKLAKEGSIYRLRLGPKLLYMPLQFVVGVYEFHLNTIDRETAELMEEYLPKLGEVWQQSPTKQLRVVPVSSVLDAAPAVDTYDRIRDYALSQELISIAPCICRKEQALLDNPCKRPLETCMQFGFGADYYLENGMARKIDKDEAAAILDLADKSALVLSPGNIESPLNICMCCGCCCGVLRNLKRFPKPADEVNSAFKAEIDADACSNCGTCMERCQMDAIEAGDKAHAVDADRCIGCALCVPTCPEEAIKLVAITRKVTVPKSMPEMSIRIVKERSRARK